MPKYTLKVVRSETAYLTVEAPSAGRAAEWFRRGERTIYEDEWEERDASDWVLAAVLPDGNEEETKFNTEE